MNKTVNGIEINRLVETINAVKQNPELASFKFRTSTEWINGGHSRTKIQGFYGVGQEDISRKEPFILDGDEPSILLGTNKGPNAVELILASLASCLSVGIVYNAAARGIEIKYLGINIEGDIDLQGFLGLSEDVRPGYQDIRINCKIESDVPRDKLEELCEHVQKTSPVLDMIANKISVTVNME